MILNITETQPHSSKVTIKKSKTYFTPIYPHVVNRGTILGSHKNPMP